MKYKSLIIFGVGVAVGALGTWKFFDKKCEEQISAMENVLKNSNKEKENESENTDSIFSENEKEKKDKPGKIPKMGNFLPHCPSKGAKDQISEGGSL